MVLCAPPQQVTSAALLLRCVVLYALIFVCAATMPWLERAPGSDSRAIRGKERCLQVIRAPQRRPYNLYFEAINYYYSYLRYCLPPRASSSSASPGLLG